MGLYTRRQLALMLLLLAAAGFGIGVAHWRAAHPELAERLERLDLEIAQADDPRVEQPRASADVGAPRPRARGEAEARPARPRPPKREAPTAGEPDPPLDLNQATLNDLLRLP